MVINAVFGFSFTGLPRGLCSLSVRVALRYFFLLLFLVGHCATAWATTVVVAEIHGAISPASADYFLRVLKQAEKTPATLLVLKLDTPGGLDSAMREITQGILNAKVPVATFVFPSGARAASAGTYILYASHIAAMAPGTNLGAATPVSLLGGEHDKQASQDKTDEKKKTDKQTPHSAMDAKVMHDAAAYLRSFAQLRGRNVEWAERAVREAVSLSAQEAVKLNVVDLIATDVPDLLKRIEGRSVKVGDTSKNIALAGAVIEQVERNWKERLLSVVADPNVALILMMIGIYGLLFEFYSPGMAVPGVLGGICLLLGLYSLALLPVNYAGVALLLLGLSLLIAEAFVPSFGVLGIGGVVAFVMGSMMLVDAEVPGMTISWMLIGPVAMAMAALLVLTGVYAMRARRRGPVSGAEGMIGGSVQVLEDITQEGWGQAFGERWRVRTKEPLRGGTRAKVIAIDGLTLLIEPE